MFPGHRALREAAERAAVFRRDGGAGRRWVRHFILITQYKSAAPVPSHQLLELQLSGASLAVVLGTLVL